MLGFLVFSKVIVLIASAVFIGVLFKAGLDVFDRDFLIAYVKGRWHLDRNRNIQLAFIAYATLLTVFIDLNVAVVSGTLLFYLIKRFVPISDAEGDLSEVHSAELLGQQV